MIDWNKLFSQEFFFEIDRGILHRSDWVVLIAGALMVLAGLVFLLLHKTKQNPFLKQTLKRLSKLLITIGVLELLWFGFRYEAVRWFGTHFAAALVFAVGLVWLGFILTEYFKNHKSKTEQWQKEQIKLKYLAQK